MVWIDETRCVGCGACAAACLPQAIEMMDGMPLLQVERCNGCGECVTACPEGAIAWETALPAPRRQTPLVSRPTATVLARPVPAPARSLWPAVGAALTWAVRELLPQIWLARQGTAAADASQQPGPTGVEQQPAATSRPQRGRRHRRGRQG